LATSNSILNDSPESQAAADRERLVFPGPFREKIWIDPYRRSWVNSHASVQALTPRFGAALLHYRSRSRLKNAAFRNHPVHYRFNAPGRSLGTRPGAPLNGQANTMMLKGVTPRGTSRRALRPIAVAC
jgi:hypothetical protein